MTGWLSSKTRHAPEALRERVVSFVGEPGPDAALSERLASAGGEALQCVLAHGGDRSVALDLLSADALITLALLEQAERDPDQLEAFAADLVRAEPGGSSESAGR